MFLSILVLTIKWLNVYIEEFGSFPRCKLNLHIISDKLWPSITNLQQSKYVISNGKVTLSNIKDSKYLTIYLLLTNTTIPQNWNLT